MWVFGEPLEGFNRQKLTCKLCGKEMTRGVSWLKYFNNALRKFSGMKWEFVNKQPQKLFKLPINQH